MVHLIPTTTRVTAPQLAALFLKDIVRLHGLPLSIVSDRDTKFTSKFWRETHRLLGTKLLMSTAFHPQTDGASERMIRTITQILRAAVAPDQLNWVEKLPMVEFAINSSVSASTGFAPFDLNYGYLPTMGGPMPSSPYNGVRQFVQQARDNLVLACDALIESRVHQAHHANRARSEAVRYEVGSQVYLSTANLSLPKGRVRKLLPKFIGPFKILEARDDNLTYKLDLPSELKDRRIHTTFHTSLLRPFHANDAIAFPKRDASAFYDYGMPEDQEWVVDSIIDHKWQNRNVLFKLRWSLGDVTWEPQSECKDLQALDEYLALMGVSEISDLPQISARDGPNMRAAGSVRITARAGKP